MDLGWKTALVAILAVGLLALKVWVRRKGLNRFQGPRLGRRVRVLLPRVEGKEESRSESPEQSGPPEVS